MINSSPNKKLISSQNYKHTNSNTPDFSKTKDFKNAMFFVDKWYLKKIDFLVESFLYILKYIFFNKYVYFCTFLYTHPFGNRPREYNLCLDRHLSTIVMFVSVPSRSWHLDLILLKTKLWVDTKWRSVHRGLPCARYYCYYHCWYLNRALHDLYCTCGSWIII